MSGIAGIFYFDGNRWFPKALNNTPVVHMNKETIEPVLHKLGFTEVKTYGGMFLGELFRYPLDPLESDWLNVVAKR